MTNPALPRLAGRLALIGAIVWSLAGCAPAGPPVQTSFDPLDFSYLTKIPLNVAQIGIDDSWTPPAGSRQVGYLAPTSPVDALRLMAQQRLVAAGNTGQANFVIEDASLAIVGGNFSGNFVVRLDVATTGGQRSGFAAARVSRTATIGDTSPAAERAALDALERQMMADMNVEFEYQVRRSLRDYLMPDQQTAPPPAPVQSQDLGPVGPPPPGGSGFPTTPGGGAPTPLTPPAGVTLSPPPQTLGPPAGSVPPAYAPPAPSYSPSYSPGYGQPTSLVPPPSGAAPAYPPPAPAYPPPDQSSFGTPTQLQPPSSPNYPVGVQGPSYQQPDYQTQSSPPPNYQSPGYPTPNYAPQSPAYPVPGYPPQTPYYAPSPDGAPTAPFGQDTIQSPPGTYPQPTQLSPD